MTVGCLNSGVETSKGAGNVLYLEVHKRENSKKIQTYLYIHGSDAAEGWNIEVNYYCCLCLKKGCV